jgi:hypothetical protein
MLFGEKGLCRILLIRGRGTAGKQHEYKKKKGAVAYISVFHGILPLLSSSAQLLQFPTVSTGAGEGNRKKKGTGTIFFRQHKKTLDVCMRVH